MYSDLQYSLIVFLCHSLLPVFLSPKVVGQLAQQMIGYNLATKQTPKEGVKVNKVIRMFLVILSVLKTKEQRAGLGADRSNEPLFFGSVLFLFRECCVFEERPKGLWILAFTKSQ